MDACMKEYVLAQLGPGWGGLLDQVLRYPHNGVSRDVPEEQGGGGDDSLRESEREEELWEEEE
eukprot:758997-Hanusia_phi.AAC.2